MARSIIVDNDCGIDDAWALNLLLHSKDIDVLAVTCVNGNTNVDYVCHNNTYFLAVADKSEIPVFRGAEKPLLPREVTGIPGPDHEYFHGRNGFGDVTLPDIQGLPVVQRENAVVALQRITSNKKGEVILVCLGPLTNIALAIRTYSDFKNNVKELYIMGGNYTAMGNTTMTAEFNFFTDPEAAHIVLSEMPSKITLLPWETCLGNKISFEWRDELGRDGGPIIELLNLIERPIITRTRKLGYNLWINADQLLAGCLINRGLVEEAESVFATIELSGIHTRGQLVIDHLGVKDHNITLIKKVNTHLYKEMLLHLKEL